MEKVKVSLMLTKATLAQLKRLERVLVHGVELSRGDVVGYLAAKESQALGLEHVALPDAMGEVATEGEEGNG